ncbi:MAG: GAF domain-containing protein [Vulcanimicrobiota bacterium]
MRDGLVKLLKDARGKLLELAAVEAALVLLRDDPAGPMLVRAVRGVEAADLEKDTCSNLLLAEAEGHGRSVIVLDSRQEIRFHNRLVDFRSALCVPITIQGRTSGLLLVLNRQQPRAFEADHRRQVEELAAQLAHDLVAQGWGEAEPDSSKAVAPKPVAVASGRPRLLLFLMVWLVMSGATLVGRRAVSAPAAEPVVVVEGELRAQGHPASFRQLRQAQLEVGGQALGGGQLELLGQGRFRLRWATAADSVELQVKVPDVGQARARASVTQGAAQLGQLQLR